MKKNGTLRRKITKAEINLADTEDNLVKAELATSLTKMRYDKLIILVRESKIAAEHSREILNKLKDI
jgi:hypothetical protein